MTASIHKALDNALVRAKTIDLDVQKDKWILFSDHHRGRRDGADDFLICEPAYKKALDHYFKNDFTLSLLGDVEEFWENPIYLVLLKYKELMMLEKRYFDENRLFRIWGNHDDQWQFTAPLSKHLEWLFPKIQVHESIQLNLIEKDRSIGKMLLVHGHQGNLESDKYAWLSKIFVRYIWRNVQRLFKIPLSTPSKDLGLRSQHDRAMLNWAKKRTDQAIVCGHTHQAVFESLTKLDRLQIKLDKYDSKGLSEKEQLEKENLEKKISHIRSKNTSLDIPESNSVPRYFNTGCCSYSDGDITGIELESGKIRLVKWRGGNNSERKILEETSIVNLFQKE